MSLRFLLQRRSVIASRLGDPGPSKAQIDDLVRAAIRVPDHKVLAPWRFLVFTGEARLQFGQKAASIYQKLHGKAYLKPQIAVERDRFLRAPLVIAVIASPKESDTVPVSEQFLSAGAACQNILHAAKALGFAAQWITEWIAYDPDIHHLLGLKEQESVAGFIYVGTAQMAPKERRRAALKDVMTYWQGD